jgi:hypothetical protein
VKKCNIFGCLKISAEISSLKVLGIMMFQDTTRISRSTFAFSLSKFDNAGRRVYENTMYIIGARCPFHHGMGGGDRSGDIF